MQIIEGKFVISPSDMGIVILAMANYETLVNTGSATEILDRWTVEEPHIKATIDATREDIKDFREFDNGVFK